MTSTEKPQYPNHQAVATVLATSQARGVVIGQWEMEATFKAGFFGPGR